MSKRVKISVFTVLFIIVIIGLLHFQTKRIVLELIASNASDRVKVSIGRLNVNVFNSRLNLQDVVVMMKENNSESFKKSSVRSVFLDVASLWDFYFGGTLVIEKLQLEGGDILIYHQPKTDTIRHSEFDLRAIIQRIKTDAIRFRIQDIAFLDFNLTMVNDSAHAPTTIKHLQVRARDLYLSADSILKKKPKIEFSLPGQTIISSKGLSIGFDSLFFSSTDNSIQLNKLELNSPNHISGNSYQVHTDKVRIAHFDFETLYTRGMVVTDSVFLGRSNLKVAWRLEPSGRNNNKSSPLPSMPEIDIKHLNVEELSSNITVRQEAVENNFSVDHAFVTAEHLHHKPDSSQKISAQKFNILLAKYSTFLSNRNTAISFDTVQLEKHRLSLLNFKLSQADQKQPVLQTSTFELNQIDWYALLINKKLVAREALVFNPIVHTSVKLKSNPSSGDNMVVLKSLNEFLNVQYFSIRNATAYVRLIDQDLNLTMKGIHSRFLIDAMLAAKDINEVLSNVEDLSFRNLQMSHPGFNGHIDNFNFRQGAMAFGTIAYESDYKINFGSSNLTIGKIDWDQSRHHLTLTGLGWRTMHADINQLHQVKQKKDSTFRLPGIRIDKIRGGDTKFDFETGVLSLSTLLGRINLEELKWDESLHVSGIDITGNDIRFTSGLMVSTINTYSITDHGGMLEQIRFRTITGDSLDTSIIQIAFLADMPKLAERNFYLNEFHAQGMTTRYLKRDSIQQYEIEIENNLDLKDIRYHEKKFSIGSLTLESGPFNVLHSKRVTQAEVAAAPSTKAGLRKLRLGMDTVFNESNSLAILEQTQHAKKEPAAFMTDNAQDGMMSTSLKGDRGGIRLSLSEMEAFTPDCSLQVKAKVNSVKFNRLSLSNNNVSAEIETGTITNLVINSNHLKNIRQWIEDNYPVAGIDNLKVRMETKENLIQFTRMDYHPARARGSIKGFEFRPLKSKQEFLDESPYQTNFMHTRIDSITFSQLNIRRFMEDSAVHLQSLNISSPDLVIHRDKTRPFFSTAIKPLPTNAFKKIPVKFKLDTLKFDDGTISYTEKSRITGKEGSINFTQLRGLVSNIRNIDLKEKDSLYIHARTRFLDSAKVTLRVRESYRDSLGGFLLTTSVSPFHTSILNKALVPMVAVEFKSGHIDTLQMHALGREYLSLGSMKFLYHDLKVNFLDKSDTSKHSLKNQLLKFAANTFVIRTNNRGRTGSVFYERDRNRAVFQYWVKMILSGAATSVGAKSNRKQIKRYMKDLNQKRLPPINEDFDL